MPHLKLTIAYDGTGLVGWQRQLTGTSVQGLLEDALAPLEGAPVTVTAAGRTDAGVHALAQVASTVLTRAIEPAAVVRAVNARLPPAVRVLSAEPVEAAFHARFDAVTKTYRYRIWNGDVVSPFERPYVWQVAGAALDVEAMQAAAARLEGRHDFAAFEGTGSEPESTERTIFSSCVRATGVRLEPDATGGTGDQLITYEVCGDGFLRHMVRALVGTLIEVGRGKRAPEWVDEVIASRDRHRAGRTAPASGLFLVHVHYEPRGRCAVTRDL
jgi:tRNA pseudouridine38-40 synthase